MRSMARGAVSCGRSPMPFRYHVGQRRDVSSLVRDPEVAFVADQQSPVHELLGEVSAGGVALETVDAHPFWVVVVVSVRAVPASTTTILGLTPISQPSRLCRYASVASVMKNSA